MKRFLSAALALAMAGVLAVTAFAANSWVSKEDVYPGDTITVHGFYTKDGKELDESGLDSEYYSVGFSGKKNGSYVDRVYIDDSSSEVKLVIKPGISISSSKEISGTVTVRETDRDSDRLRFTADITLNLGGGGTARMVYAGSQSFELPDEYQNQKVKFETEDGESIGTLRADFWDESYNSVAYFNVKVIDQASLFVGHNSTPDVNLMKKNDSADLRFLSWSAAPTFDATGTLGIYCYSDDYVYGRKSDGTLYKLDGKYNSSTGAYEIKTKTLGSYVISDKALSAGGSASSSSSASSSASSVAPAPSSSSAAPVPSSSTSVAPPVSSSVAAPASSESSQESSEPEEESSLPEESSSEPEEEPSEPVAAPDEDEDDKGGFPVVPVVIGVLAVVVVGLAIFLFGGGKKKRSYDSWDD